MICRLCQRGNGRTGNDLEARFCSYCRRYGPDESKPDAAAWCDRCGYTGEETTCPNCGPHPISKGERAAILDGLQRAKEREKNNVAMLTCQDCGTVTPWEEWLNPEAFELCPKCGSHNARLNHDDEVPF